MLSIIYIVRCPNRAKENRKKEKRNHGERSWKSSNINILPQGAVDIKKAKTNSNYTSKRKVEIGDPIPNYRL